MSWRRLDVADVAAFHEANPHANVLEPLGHPEKKRYYGFVDADRRVVATVSLQRRALRCDQVGAVLVAPALQGTGLGRRLMDETFRQSRADGARWLALGSYRRPPDVGPFYRACGFRTLIPWLPGGESRGLAGPVARGLARLFGVEAGPDPVAILVRRV